MWRFATSIVKDAIVVDASLYAVTGCERRGQNPLDEFRLTERVRLAGRLVARVQFVHEALFDLFVLPRGAGMSPQVIAKRERAPLLLTTALDDMHMMRVRPRRGSMKERTDRIVRMRNVDIPERLECLAVVRERMKVVDRDLNVDHGFRGQTGHGC